MSGKARIPGASATQKAFDGCFESCAVAEARFMCRVRAAAIEFCGEVHLYLHPKLINGVWKREYST